MELLDIVLMLMKLVFGATRVGYFNFTDIICFKLSLGYMLLTTLNNPEVIGV